METVISIQNLSKSFEGNQVLTGVELTVNKGENVVVLGRSGSGKSVLIKLVAGLLKQDGGSVHVLGRNVAALNRNELQGLRQHIGFSFQGSALYDGMSVRENLEFPLVRNKRNLKRNQITEAVEQVLADVGLSQTINQMPSELSGGQKKNRYCPHIDPES